MGSSYCNPPPCLSTPRYVYIFQRRTPSWRVRRDLGQPVPSLIEPDEDKAPVRVVDDRLKRLQRRESDIPESRGKDPCIIAKDVIQFGRERDILHYGADT